MLQLTEYDGMYRLCRAYCTKSSLRETPPPSVYVMHQLKLIDLGNVKDASRALHLFLLRKISHLLFPPHISVLQDTERLHAA